jgi:hypothetical protein
MSYKYDYSELEQFLSEKRWGEADQVTANIIFRMANQGEGFSLGESVFLPLTEKSIEALPCEELNAIDRLWTHYSNGLFGFSVQLEIWKGLGSPLNLELPSNKRAEKSFFSQVGWSSKKNASENFNKGCFPLAYGAVSGNGYLDYLETKYTPLAYVLFGVGIICFFQLLFFNMIATIILFLIAILVQSNMGLVLFRSSHVFMLLSRMTKCKRT